MKRDGFHNYCSGYWARWERFPKCTVAHAVQAMPWRGLPAAGMPGTFFSQPPKWRGVHDFETVLWLIRSMDSHLLLLALMSACQSADRKHGAPTQRLRVAVWYVHRLQSYDMVTPLRPGKYHTATWSLWIFRPYPT